MKLSTKFFIIAYIVVLLTTGLGGMFIVKSVTDTLLYTRKEQVDSAARYAADSFSAFADIASSDFSPSRRSNVEKQIKGTLGDVVSAVKIHTVDTIGDDYKNLKTNEGLSQFLKTDDSLIYESVCRLYCYNDNYYLTVRSDFTATKRQCDRFWSSYTIVVIAVSAAGGLALFLLSKRITKSLGRLTQGANEVALGKYGKKVFINGSDREIQELADSFNVMSAAVEQKISEIKEESNKREMFVADFTHELKTPMTAIMGYSQMLMSYDLSSDERNEAASAIYSEAKRLESLSGQMLNLYVYKNEEIKLERVPLREIEAQLKTTLKFLSEKYGVHCEIELCDQSVSANRILLLSLLYNLADNAYKASTPGGAVKIFCREDASSVTLFVADNGRGIAKENLHLLTEPFFREDKSRSRELGGAGLGLSLCKEIATIHQSQLQFESEKGVGTTVSFTLRKDGERGE